MRHGHDPPHHWHPRQARTCHGLVTRLAVTSLAARMSRPPPVRRAHCRSAARTGPRAAAMIPLVLGRRMAASSGRQAHLVSRRGDGRRLSDVSRREPPALPIPKHDLCTGGSRQLLVRPLRLAVHGRQRDLRADTSSIVRVRPFLPAAGLQGWMALPQHRLGTRESLSGLTAALSEGPT